ncbi:MAG: TRAP transporter substrate-binding protein DctP [Spirochaetota bacterium]
MKNQKYGIILTVFLFCASMLMAGGVQESEAQKPAADVQTVKVSDAPIYNFKWATAAAAEQPATIISEKICSEILQASNGRIKITLYPGSVLGAERDCLDMLRAGTIQFMTTGPSIFNSFYDPVQALTLPYLFKDVQHAYKYFNDEFGQKMFNDIILKKTGIRTIAWRNYRKKEAASYTVL